ncbi:hypothetical protein H4R21_002143 [Coemansia helicoidea]|uniref:Uncharacterized protein n=1 Tax=Coemansia helicoidea TaxID=1286919 RepID=A0ACC1L9B3_9FUNG|nr:hypothetical protein H4R21_002143 [Coemansia helicoidea]
METAGGRTGDVDYDESDFEDVSAAAAPGAAPGGDFGGDEPMPALGTVEITFGGSDDGSGDDSDGIRGSKRRRRAVVTERARAVRCGHHMAHMMCHVVAARLMNGLCCSEEVRALAMSLVPAAIADRLAQHREPGGRAVRREWASADLRSLLASYGALQVTHRPRDDAAAAAPIRDELVAFLASREATRAWHRPMLLTAMLRAFAFDARLCAGLTPPPPRLTVRESEAIEHSFQDGASNHSDPVAQTPVPRYWVEAYDVSSGKWLPVNADSGAIEADVCAATSAYVLAFDADGTMRDITRRYAPDYVNTTLRLRLESASDERTQTWWPRWIAQWERPGGSERDAREEAELEERALAAAMPRRIADFAANPFYVLQRNLAQNEVLHPPGPIVGAVRGESVYLREHVRRVRSRMAWVRAGRVVHADAQPAKRIRSRAATADEAPAETDLFGEWQTDIYRAPPVVDGRVPRNNYGRVDLFVPSMLPAGAAHVAAPGARRVCRELGIDAADAVVGFEFRRGISTPVVHGVVIPSDARDLVLDALRDVEHVAAASRRASQEARALDRWRRLLRSLRVRAEVDATFASRSARPAGITFKPGAKADADADADDYDAHDTGAGFLV